MNGRGSYYGFAFYERSYAESVATIMEHMTGDRCMVVQRGAYEFLVVRNNGSGRVIA